MQLRYIMPLLLIAACTSEEELKNYTVSVTNSSSVAVEILGYNGESLAFSKQIDPKINVEICSYTSESFTGISCQNDSIVFKFANGKGYSCDLRGGTDNFCFKNKDPFVDESSFSNQGGKNYIFVIDELDFENAHELP